MKALGLIIGVIGMLTLIVTPIGGILLVLGALLFIVGARQERTETEERRHRELLAATRERSQK